jgi:hypothetical protein
MHNDPVFVAIAIIVIAAMAALIAYGFVQEHRLHSR